MSEERKPIQVLKGSDLDLALKESLVIYKQQIEIRRRMIDYDMKTVYGRKIFFKECETTEMELRIKSVIHETTLSLGSVARYLNEYVGYDLSFFRSQGDKRIPVELERIKKAYFAAKERKAFWQIEKILYEED